MANDLTDELQRNIPLSEMLQTLRTELGAALEAGRGASLRFDLEQVDLELQVKLVKTSEVGGKASFLVICGGSSMTTTDAAVHTFKLRLKPRWSDGTGPVQISDSETTLPN